MVDTFVEFILAQDPFLVIVLLMLLSALENIFPPVPADVAAALGAFWAVRTGHSPIWVGFLCFAANQASAIAVYYWVRARGEAVLRSAVGARRLIPLMPTTAMPLGGRAQLEHMKRTSARMECTIWRAMYGNGQRSLLCLIRVIRDHRITIENLSAPCAAAHGITANQRS